MFPMVLALILVLNLAYSLIHLVRHHTLHSGWWMVLSLTAFIA